MHGIIINAFIPEFRIMPFDIQNAPAVFQRLMQSSQLLTWHPSGHPSLKPLGTEHLHLVTERLVSADLMLKPVKC